MATAQFERVAERPELDDELRTRLIEPRRSMVVYFPGRMDDATVEMFTCYRVQHTLTMGPTKGGLRFAAIDCDSKCVTHSNASSQVRATRGGLPHRSLSVAISRVAEAAKLRGIYP